MGGLRCVVCGATFSDTRHNRTYPGSPLTWRLPTCSRCGASYFEHVDIVTWQPERRERPEPDPALWEHAWGIPFSEYSSEGWPKRDWRDDAWWFWCALCGGKLKRGRRRAFCSNCLDMLRLRGVLGRDWPPAPKALAAIERQRRRVAARGAYVDVTPEPEYEYPDGWMLRAPYSSEVHNREYRESHHIKPGKVRVPGLASYEAVEWLFEAQDEQARGEAWDYGNSQEPLVGARDPDEADSSDVEGDVLALETLREARDKLTAIEWAILDGALRDMSQQEIADSLTADGRQWNQSAISRRLAKVRLRLKPEANDVYPVVAKRIVRPVAPVRARVLGNAPIRPAALPSGDVPHDGPYDTTLLKNYWQQAWDKRLLPPRLPSREGHYNGILADRARHRAQALTRYKARGSPIQSRG